MPSHSGLGRNVVASAPSLSSPLISCSFCISYTLPRIQTPLHITCTATFPLQTLNFTPTFSSAPCPHANTHLAWDEDFGCSLVPSLLDNYISFCFCSWWEELFIFPQEVLSLRWENMFPGWVYWKDNPQPEQKSYPPFGGAIVHFKAPLDLHAAPHIRAPTLGPSLPQWDGLVPAPCIFVWCSPRDH